MLAWAASGCLHAVGARPTIGLHPSRRRVPRRDMRCVYLMLLLLQSCVADMQEVRAHLARLRGTMRAANASATQDECTLEEACQLSATLRRLHGPRVVLPNDLEKAWPSLFGEQFRDRHNHVPIIVLLHCFSSERREQQLQKYLTPQYLGKHRHVFASDRTDVSRGILGFPDDPGRGGVDFKTNGAKYISASRGAAVPSRHRCDSCSSDEVVGGFFFEFEAVRTELRDSDAPRRRPFLICPINYIWSSSYLSCWACRRRRRRSS